ncbi:hypothetical protein EYF80_006207 [Liparis tanakae]|uniref:Uncharacterized protein n=1 Tax=Liparis tanakae TaxID=230148 RepID=A0A4Z2J0E9_9TELE|nr:hypothetical protein EYF80_006207 [Liparis tanakae]
MVVVPSKVLHGEKSAETPLSLWLSSHDHVPRPAVSFSRSYSTTRACRALIGRLRGNGPQRYKSRDCLLPDFTIQRITTQSGHDVLWKDPVRSKRPPTSKAKLLPSTERL